MESGVSAKITPERSLTLLSSKEVNRLKDKSEGGLYGLFRRCSLAVLNCGNESDDSKAILAAHAQFDIKVVQQPRGIKLEVSNAPVSAFVDDVMIKGIKEHLFAVLRDIVYANTVLKKSTNFNLERSEDITDFIFHILRNAEILIPGRTPDIVVCWGGHSISRFEYDYTKEVGHQLGLRDLNVCTGCGPGAMKGPMKG
ncbi:MAG: pyrimidine/purine nucleosidase domain-containing protein, partial [Pseudomonadales bacterium]|nr:pyrimidine/purine nucleosidase domain-containing protein [Pseudomonadales bacterium]